MLRSLEKQAVTRAWIAGLVASPVVGFVMTMFFAAMMRYMTNDAAWTTMTFFASATLIGTGLGIRSWLRKDRKKLAGIVDLLGYVARGASVPREVYSALPAANVEPQMLTVGRSN